MDKTLYHKSHSPRNGKNRVLVLLVAILLYSCQKENSEIRLLFVGDILLSRNVEEEYKTRKSDPWENLDSLFHSADLVIGNLEGAVGNPDGDKSSPTESPVFAIDKKDIALLEKAGFKAITIENNHSLDMGSEGKTKTVSALIEYKIKPVSFENSPYFFSIKDLVISVVTVNLVLNRDSTKYQIPSIALSQKLRLAKTLSNIVIVSVHWGSELLEWPNNEQREAAKWLIANGADIIIGHHPHVIQQPELVNGKPVYFSLGNHLFDQKYLCTKEGLIAEVVIENGKINCNGFRTKNQKNSFFPEIDGTKEEYFKSIKYNGNIFTINDLTIMPITLETENKTLLRAYKNNQFVWQSHPMSLVALEKINTDDKDDNLFSLEYYYSSLDKEFNIRPYVYSVDDKGITAKWRGSALAWPISDAKISPDNKQILCALHRGDAFVSLGSINMKRKIAAYKWNGFGFNGLNDSIACVYCKDVF